jgi:hypothetical protein
MTQPMEVRGSGSTRSSAQPAGSVDFRQPASRLETPRPAPVVLRVARLGGAAAVCPRHHRPAHVFALYRLPWHPDSSGARYRRGRALFHAFLAAHLIIAAIGIVLMREECRQLLMVPVYRIIYEPVAGLSAIHSRLHGGPWRPRRLEQTCPHRNVGHRSGNSPPACATGGCNRRND